MPKDSIRDKLEGNELDLSLSNLTVVPVKEIAAIPKATKLDLSCNLLDTLPDVFCTLTQLTRLDLSKNQLTELPNDFGNLKNLQHLDLLGNKLQILPVSFENFDKLRWLDVKDNPLDEGLVKAAGDCLDVSQCQLCAKRVVAYMKTVSAELEKRKQLRLKRQREKEAQKIAKEEEERKRKKAEKIAEKERKKREFLNRKKGDSKQSALEDGETDIQKVIEPQVNGFHSSSRITKDEGRSGCTCFLNIFAILFIGLLAVSVGLYINCDVNRKQEYCKNYVIPFFNEMRNNLDRCFIRVTEYAEQVKGHLYK